MSLQSRIVLSLAAAILWHPASAMAADYEPPIVVENAPEYVPVEVGSGWYLRGDLTVNLNRPVYRFSLLGQDTNNNRVGGEIGFGYHFTDYLRADLTTGFVSSDKFDFDDRITSIEASNRVWTGLANGYVDLGTIAGFTPYVGAGLGVLYSKAKLEIDSPLLDAEWSKRQTRFAYALNAGMSYNWGTNTSVDLSYRFLSSPGTEFIDADSLEIRKGMNFHQLKLGLRYDLW
jgi:opacity protein-like surface antigen